MADFTLFAPVAVLYAVLSARVRAGAKSNEGTIKAILVYHIQQRSLVQHRVEDVSNIVHKQSHASC